MSEAGIGTSVHYKPLFRLKYYRETYKLSEQDFPNAERTWQGTVSLPIYPGLTKDEQAYIVDTVKKLLS